MVNCMINPYTGKAILKSGPTAKKIRADRMGRFARGLLAKAPAPAPAKRGRGRPKGSKNKPKK